MSNLARCELCVYNKHVNIVGTGDGDKGETGDVFRDRDDEREMRETIDESWGRDDGREGRCEGEEREWENNLLLLAIIQVRPKPSF